MTMTANGRQLGVATMRVLRGAAEAAMRRKTLKILAPCAGADGGERYGLSAEAAMVEKP